MKPEKCDALLKLSLDNKVEYSKKIIKEALDRFYYDDLFIAWTGGKDSTLVLWLFHVLCEELKVPKPQALFIDEGDVFEEIFELVYFVKKKWAIEVAFVKNTDVSDKAHRVGDLIAIADLNKRNRKEIEKLGITEDFFPFEPESLYCNHLMKTVAMNVFLEENDVRALSTGIRWDEQDARVGENFFSVRENPVHTRVHPILHFKERDIWNTIQQHNIPFCSLYYQGYRSLGARATTAKNSDIPAWEQDLENTPERAGRDQNKEQIMLKLRSLGYM